MLGLMVGESALSLLRLSASVDGTPLEWRLRLCPTTNLAYTVARDI